MATGYATPEFRGLMGRFRMKDTYVIATRPLRDRRAMLRVRANSGPPSLRRSATSALTPRRRIFATSAGFSWTTSARSTSTPQSWAGSFVGADAVGVALATRIDESRALRIAVDIGTNGEILLGNRERMLSASSPTGPAFEGAQIVHGMRAAPGAMERVHIDEKTLEPKYKVIGIEGWNTDHHEFKGHVKGICGSAIIEVVAEMYLCGIISEDGVIDGSLASRTPRITPSGRTWSYLLRDGKQKITVTQNDVRAVQLAKAALYAGIKLLMEKQGVKSVDTIRLAGAFGSFIDPKYAMVLGLIPDCDLAEVKSVGNAAGTGALMALLSRDLRREIEREVSRIEKIETAVEPRFQAHFIDAMAFPHATAPYPNLAREVQLPARRSVAGTAREPAIGRRPSSTRPTRASRSTTSASPAPVSRSRWSGHR